MEEESNKVQLENVWPILQPQCLPSLNTTPEAERSSFVHCNTEEILVHQFDMLGPTITTNEHKTFNDAIILKDDEFLDSNTVDPNISDNSNFGVRSLRPHTIEKESNKGKTELVRPMLQNQCLASLSSCLPSFDTTPRNSSADCSTEEIRVHELEMLEPSVLTNEKEYGNDILKDVIVKECEFMDPFTLKIAKFYHNIFKYINPNVIGKANVLDNSNYEERSYNRPQSASFERIQHEMQPQANDLTALDVDNKLLPDDCNIEDEVQTNQMLLDNQTDYLTTMCSTLSLQPIKDVIKLTVCLQRLQLRKCDGKIELLYCGNSPGLNLMLRVFFHLSTSGVVVVSNSFYRLFKAKDATEIDIDNNSFTVDGNIGIAVQTNQMLLVKEAFHFTRPTEYSQAKDLTALDIDNKSLPDYCNFGNEVQTNQIPLDLTTVCRTVSLKPKNDVIESTAKDGTEIDIDNNLRTEDGNIGVEVQTNEMLLVREAFHFTSPTKYSQDVPKDGESNDEYSRKTTEESDDVGSSDNKENLEIMNSRDAHENEPMHSTEIHNGTRNKPLQNHKCNQKGDDVRHVCQTCKKSFRHLKSLRSHCNIHTGKRPYTCDICNKSFRHSANLYGHKKLHSGAKPHSCKLCDKSFREKSQLKRHSSTHLGAKPFACNVCQKTFTRKNGLQLHSYIHTGEKPYVCKVCHKAFTHNSCLHSHSYLHTDERPYTCQLCGKSYKTRGNFFKHSKKCSN